MAGPVLDDGALVVRRGRIEAVGRWRVIKGETGKVIDLGVVVLLPGLVNAHCHLDYTDMAGQFPPPKVFTDWLKVITATKAGWTLSDFAESWRNGAHMLVRTGTTSVGDIEAVPQLLPEVWRSTPLRVLSYLEMIGITSRRPPKIVLAEAVAKIRSLGRERERVGLSPHAPYSTVPELLRRVTMTANRWRWRVCTHVAESALEYAMFARGRGEMFAWLKRSGRDMSDCGLDSPIRHLENCFLLNKNLLVAHANYLGRKDAERLGKNGVSVVHCPRSHAYFRHGPFPLGRLTRAGVNVCLGTDSLASVCKVGRQRPELNMFEEMRALAKREPGLPPKRILEMATRCGARALGWPVGELATGKFADIIAVPSAEGPPSAAYEAVLRQEGPVPASLIGGRWAIEPKLN